MITRIKYDERSLKISKTLTIAFGIIPLLTFIFACLSDPKSELSSFLTLVSAASIIIFLFTLFLYLDNMIYLKRLTSNHFTIPINKNDYENDLSNLPRTEAVENRYAKDSKIAAVIALVIYAIFLICDFQYLFKWMKYIPKISDTLFIPLLVFHLMFPIAALYFHFQCNTDKYIDEVDISDGRKTRKSIMKAIELLIFLSVLSFYSLFFSHGLTLYLYVSPNSSHDRPLNYFQDNATMTVTSNDLHNGIWDAKIINTPEGSCLSPHLYFQPVDGADHYVIYMVDETDQMLWLATEIRDNELFTGENLTTHANDPYYQYIGPDPRYAADKSTCTIYVYALKGDPCRSISNINGYGGDDLYYDILNVIEEGKPNLYGNVLSYGFISGIIVNKR